ncbi:branched-chain amino acid aminotransferase II [Kipferlia bialata]|uniref:Branched-chain-amino-acid aminotransferase n=1 Tax=Kipferlia bialata TaxID=797122 RepID=A0A391NTZ9_9EUKA|nr:branched-chain amino acid aminotransferase II [Kipferlia bialata]|eukprot:g1362.t1
MSIPVADLTIELTQTPTELPPQDKLKFGHCFSDHMLECDWTDEEGWGVPRIVPFHNMSIHPASTCLHYGLEIFEGLKAYYGDDDKIRLFRPLKNAQRFADSASRLDLPAIVPEELVELIKAVVKVDEKFIPKAAAHSLYIRPTLVSTHQYLGVCRPKAAKLFIILSPSGPYFATSAPKLLATDKYARAAPGGVGACKCGGNYAPTIMPQSMAAKQGCQQILWLSPDEEHFLTEVGAMNFFCVVKDGEDKKKIVTAPLDGLILPGVTRDSMLTLCASRDDISVEERPVPIKELLGWIESGELLECFGTGTAAVVTPVGGLKYKDFDADLNKSDRSVSEWAYSQITGIQWGKVEDKNNWTVVIE